MPGKRATSRIKRAIMLLAALEAGTERAPKGLCIKQEATSSFCLFLRTTVILNSKNP